MVVLDDGIGQRRHIIDEIDVAHVHATQRIVARGRAAGDAERVEAMDLADTPAGAARDTGVLALGIDADDGAIESQEVWQDGADTLARVGGGDGDKVSGTVLAEQPAALFAAADEQITGAVL